MIRKYFESFNLFTIEEIENALPFFKTKTLQKSEYFIQEGKKCKEVAFIISGIFRSYYTSEEGDETTYCFRFPNEMLAAYSSFISGNESQETMQAISTSELLVIKKKDIDQLAKENICWIKFLKVIAEQQYIELEQRVFQLQRNSAVQRYVSLLEHQPEYIQNIPLQYLASFLGITQRHLSRIRKEISF